LASLWHFILVNTSHTQNTHALSRYESFPLQ